MKKVYSGAAENPGGKHPFPMGKRFVLDAGYPEELLKKIPSDTVDVFTGVSNVSVFARFPVDISVLDVGYGGGLDAFIAAYRVGGLGKIIGIDYSDSMLDCARRAVQNAGLRNIELHLGDAERLPVEDNSIDIAMANGIFNLNPLRGMIFSELVRVLKPDGAFYGAELIRIDSGSTTTDQCRTADAEQNSLNDWFR